LNLDISGSLNLDISGPLTINTAPSAGFRGACSDVKAVPSAAAAEDAPPFEDAPPPFADAPPTDALATESLV
jgi:hypothetical protein